MTGLMAAWVAEAGLITWRTVTKSNRPPLPSEFAATFVIYGALAFLAEPAPELAAAVGWGLVLATFLNLFDPALSTPPTSRNADTGAAQQGS